MEEEYRASGAGKVFKAPQPELTDEEKKQQIDMEKERYLKDPDQEDLSQQVNYSEEIDVESLTNLQKQRQDAKENEEFDKTVAGGTLEDLRKGVEIKKRLGMVFSRLEKPIQFASEFAYNVWEDTKKFEDPRNPLNLGSNVGAVGARGIESWLTVDADNFQELGFELVEKTLDYRKGLAGSIVGEIPIVKENLARLGNTLNRLKKQWQPVQTVQNLDGTLSIVDDSIDGAKPLMSKGDTSVGAGESPLPKVRTGKSQKLTIEEKLAQRKSIFEGAAITNVEELDRTAAALVQRRGGTLSGIEFKKWNEEAIKDLQKTYKHITAGELNAHHNNIVKSGVALHEGRTGPESSLIESWLINKGVASGDSPLNNNLIPEQVHGLVHKWLNERIGSKYLTGLIGELNSPLRKRWESLPIDHPDVKKVVEQYADYVNGATERTAELMQAYYQIWGPESKITEEALDIILKKLNITELEYSQLVKPGLSGKDARMFAQGYGPKKIEVTWADGVTETMYERLSREINDDPVFAAQLDELNAKQVKVGDFSNEPTSPTPAQIRRQNWAREIEDLEYEKSVGKLSKVEKQRLEELRNLMFYGQGLPLLRNIRYGSGPFKGTQNLTEQFNPRNPKIQKTIKKSNKNNQGKLDI